MLQDGLTVGGHVEFVETCVTAYRTLRQTQADIRTSISKI
jgi:hypothetical protein